MITTQTYFSEKILEKEQKLFHQARYLGTELLLKDNYCTVPQDDNNRVLVKNKNGIELLSNVCRHRQATILQRSGATSNIVCPLHGWTYDLEGTLIAAPHFDECPQLNLRKYSTQTWNNIIFEKDKNNIITDLNNIRTAQYFSFNNYEFHSRKIHDCNYNWKTFIEVYLDDYHVVPFHPGLGNFVDCNKLDWQFGDWFSVQSVGVHNKLQTPGTGVYKRWHKALMDYRRGNQPEFGAIWLTIYPNVMIEWYPEVLVVSTVWPITPQKTRNIVDFYYPEEICHFESEFVEAHQAAYMETCDEDDEIAERIDNGRSFNYKTKMDDFGPIQQPMEAGVEYFHNYYKNFIKHEWHEDL
jgi:choline monooxygenase